MYIYKKKTNITFFLHQLYFASHFNAIDQTHEMLGKFSTLNLYSPNGLHHAYFHLNDDGVIIASGIAGIEGLPCSPAPTTAPTPAPAPQADPSAKMMLCIADISHQFTEQIDALQQKMTELEGDVHLQLSINKNQRIEYMNEMSAACQTSVADIRARLDAIYIDIEALRNSLLSLTASPTTTTTTTANTSSVPATNTSPAPVTNTSPVDAPTASTTEEKESNNNSEVSTAVEVVLAEHTPVSQHECEFTVLATHEEQVTTSNENLKPTRKPRRVGAKKRNE